MLRSAAPWHALCSTPSTALRAPGDASVSPLSTRMGRCCTRGAALPTQRLALAAALLLAAFLVPGASSDGERVPCKQVPCRMWLVGAGFERSIRHAVRQSLRGAW